MFIAFRQALVLPVLLLAAAWPLPAFPCGPDTLEPARLRGFEAGDLLLSDGRRLRLAGLEPLPRTAAALPATLPGREILLGLTGTATDRWGRLPALVFLPGAAGEAPQWLQARLLGRGEARVAADLAPADCAAALLAAEAPAIRQRLGLWGDPDYAVLTDFDPGRIAARVGRQVVVEGRIIRVNEGRRMIFADVQGTGSTRLGVWVDRRMAGRLAAAGRPAMTAWRGRTLRLRGRLEAGRSTNLRIEEPLTVEVLR
jgi:hypothetical protein